MRKQSKTTFYWSREKTGARWKEACLQI